VVNEWVALLPLPSIHRRLASQNGKRCLFAVQILSFTAISEQNRALSPNNDHQQSESTLIL
jgi:hypothetical protein